MENYEIIKHIEDYKKRIGELKVSLKLDDIKAKLASNESLMSDANFWNDNKTSTAILKEVKEQKEVINSFVSLDEKVEELELYFEMYKNDGEDLMDEIEATVCTIDKELADFEIKSLLSKPYDDCDAIVEMHPGAGGTESQDWCNMLYRMYIRYCERRGYEVEVLDYLDGDEAGIKSVSFMVKGPKAYGYMRCEQGVHRLVRISPFDSNARRHTSFASVTVFPSVNNDIDIEVKPEDIRVDVYRSSGAGGQHINKTSSAIRITHLKTGIVVSCQNQRSQFQNRDTAMQVLKSKLYQLELEQQNKAIKDASGEVTDNSFGNQIRSYVFHPYSMVKDHRTNYETGNIGAVMDGDLDGFINAYLKSSYNQGK